MLTGEIRNQVDRVWNIFWTGGISNPLAVIEQLTYLLFIKRLDELHTAREKRANRLRRPIEGAIFGVDEQHLRWSVFKNFGPEQLYTTIVDQVFPFIKQLTDDDTAFAKHIQTARFGLPPEKAGLLARVVDMLDGIPMADRDTKGDLYEYLLSKLSTAGQNGQFRTPRHIIKLMTAMVAPTPSDMICDPACGTAGFLVACAEYLREHHGRALVRADVREHVQRGMFHGFDFDNTMLRVASMNLLLHGIERPDIRNQDSLAQAFSGEADAYTVLLANPPFKGSLDYNSTAKELLKTVKTKKTELLFIALILRLLKPGGRAAVIVPDGVLFGSSRAHKTLRRLLVEGHKLEGVVSMPSGVFKPYAGVSTAILLFTKTNSGGTEHVWFYDMQADGYSLDDKRTPLDANKHESNNLPDILKRYHQRAEETERSRTDQSFLVPKKEIADNDYDLSINRYKEIVYEEIEYDPPHVILDELEQLEQEIQLGMAELRRMLG